MEPLAVEALAAVLRYLLERVPHGTQDEHDRLAAVIEDLLPASKSAPTLSKESGS